MRLVDNQPHGIPYSGPRCETCRKPSIRAVCLDCRLRPDMSLDDVRLAVADELSTVAKALLAKRG